MKEILLISTPHDLPRFEQLLGDGSQFGISIEYREQAKPEGLAQAFHIASDFLEGGPACLILGDNMFHAPALPDSLQHAVRQVEAEGGATVFGYWVKDARAYGVFGFDAQGNVNSIEEKPERPKSHYAVVGLYFYDARIAQIAADLQPSARGEYEITDVNRKYLEEGQLRAELLGRGTAWLDTGTHESLLQAGNFIETIESRQGLKVACLEEIAWELGYIDGAQVLELADKLGKTEYAQYLRDRVSGR